MPTPVSFVGFTFFLRGQGACWLVVGRTELTIGVSRVNKCEEPYVEVSFTFALPKLDTIVKNSFRD